MNLFIGSFFDGPFRFYSERRLLASGLNTLVKTNGNADTVAGGPKLPFCSEAWDAISRYIYTGLQGGSVMAGWMKDEKK